MFKELDDFLKKDILGHSETVIKRDEEQNIIKEVVVKGSIEFGEKEIAFIGIAKTAKEDYDFATVLVGENIAILRAKLDIVKTILEDFPLSKDESDFLVGLEELIDSEITNYIDAKEVFYQRVRNTRKDPDYYKVKHISIDENGFGTEL